ncbi:MAG: pilus assembly PilX N-terminal domain-containing protein [Gemmatimonadota bacterium]
MDGFDTKLGAPARNERGQALMIVLILLVGLTVLGAAGLTMTGNDIRHSENVEASTEAFYAADAGLERYLGESNNGSSPVGYTIAGAAVTVTPTPMASLAGGQDMFRVRSVATRTDTRGVTTSRAVSSLAIYKSGSGLAAPAAIASGSGLHKNGGSGKISGKDQASLGDPKCSGMPGADIAGVTVPPGGYTQSGGGKKGSVPEGDPDIDDSQSGGDLLAGTGLDWEDLHDNGGDIADYRVPPDAWPDFGSLPADAWPVIYLTGDASLTPSQSGRGSLIITGDLTMGGSFQWDGILLVGGNLTSNGNNTVSGSTITGLNILLGESVDESDLGNGTKTFQYNSCYVKAAQEGLSGGGMALVPGSWAEEI